jgi:LmbE family N-acetylglucosaminyl deacetylase
MTTNQERKPRALAAMAHPDDAEILAGGTLFHLKALGWELGILTMTSGDCGSMTHTREEITSIRHAEAEAAADFLGAWYGCAGMKDIEIFANAENMRRVVERMRGFDPDLVITHSPVDYMVDHEETSRLVRGAAFALAMPLYRTHRSDGRAHTAAVLRGRQWNDRAEARNAQVPSLTARMVARASRNR